MAAEVINLLIPGSGLHAGPAFDAAAEQKLLSRYLLVSPDASLSNRLSARPGVSDLFLFCRGSIGRP